MSTRWYPLYNKGNPQLRIFLPNFWMKLLNPKKELPQNVVQFQTSLEMTHHDVKNYLEKIYKLTVVEAKVEIMQGKTREVPGKGYVVKDDDYKVATVVLPREEKFVFPKVCTTNVAEELKEIKEAQKKHVGYTRRNLHRPGVPGWYSF